MDHELPASSLSSLVLSCELSVAGALRKVFVRQKLGACWVENLDNIIGCEEIEEKIKEKDKYAM